MTSMNIIWLSLYHRFKDSTYLIHPNNLSLTKQEKNSTTNPYLFLQITMPESLSEAIGKDHDDFDVCYNEIKRATDDATKIKWRNQLTWNVARHAISEELTWYPAMEKHMGELGKKLAAEDKEQHMSV